MLKHVELCDIDPPAKITPLSLGWTMEFDTQTLQSTEGNERLQEMKFSIRVFEKCSC